jgi:hypothetical protein
MGVVRFRDTPRNRLIIAARSRGIAGWRIGDALGVTHQFVSQVTQAYERVHGRIQVHAGPGIRHRGRVTRSCPYCGTEQDKAPTDEGPHYCCHSCYFSAIKSAIATQADAIIARRIEGEAWKDIASSLGFTHQAIQAALWRELDRQHRLDLDLVDAVWCSPKSRQQRPGSWQWLVKGTGIAPLGHKDRGQVQRYSRRWKRPQAEQVAA